MNKLRFLLVPLCILSCVILFEYHRYIEFTTPDTPLRTFSDKIEIERSNFLFGRIVIMNCLDDIAREVQERYQELYGTEEAVQQNYECSLAATKEEFKLDYKLTFEKGFIQDRKGVGGPVFEEGGCVIYFRVRFPAGKEDPEQLASFVVNLDNGISYRWRSCVRAERTEKGRKLVKEVNAIIKDGLKLMNEKLKDF